MDIQPPSEPPTPFTLPIHQAAQSIKACGKTFTETIPLDAMIEELNLCVDQGGGDLESLLAIQARALDGAFHRSLAESMKYDYVRNAEMELALKAQRQCRNSIESTRALQGLSILEKSRVLKKLSNGLKDLR